MTVCPTLNLAGGAFFSPSPLAEGLLRDFKTGQACDFKSIMQVYVSITSAKACLSPAPGMCIKYFFLALTDLFILPGVLTVLYRKMKRNATECGTEIKADMYTVYMPVIYTSIFTLNLVSALGILEELIFPCLLPTESPGGWPLGVAKHQPRFRFRRPRAGGHACSRHLGSCLACEWSRWRRVPIKRPKENDIYVIMCVGYVYSNVQMNYIVKVSYISLYHMYICP